MSDDPDPRYVLANERTLLAWLRVLPPTRSLLLLTAGIVMVGLFAVAFAVLAPG